MDSEPATTTYSIPEPFGETLRSLRDVLTGRDLRITGELDLSRRIQRNLRIGLAPCVVIYVWPSDRLLRSFVVRPSTALLLPLHVVVSGRGTRTEIHLLKLPRLDGGAHIAPIVKLQIIEVAQAIETIAMPLSLVG
jgi:uncharacterized protein (DUF302 family)